MTTTEYELYQARKKMGLCPICGRWPREGGSMCEACRPGRRKRRTLVEYRVPKQFAQAHCQHCPWLVFNGIGQPGYCMFAGCPRNPKAYAKLTGTPLPPEADEWRPATWDVTR